MDEGHALQDATSAQAYIAERDIAWIRFGIILFNVLLYVFALPHDPATHRLATVIIGVAMAYAWLVLALRPYERFHVLRTSTYTLVTDSALIAVWLYATGGIASPFYPLWMLSLVAVVFRFGPGIVVWATACYLVSDALMLWVAGDFVAANLAAMAARGAYIIAVGALGAMLGKRWRESMQERITLREAVLAQRMQVAEAEGIYALTDATFEGICIHNNGVILEVNRAFCALFDQSREDLVGAHVSTLVDQVSAQRLAERLAQPQDAQYELWIKRAGETRRVAVQGRPIMFKGEHVRVAAVRDITPQYEAEHARALAHERQLEIDRLQEIHDFRTQFINTAAHELNTPLTPIKLQFAVLKDNWQGPPRSLALMERNMGRLAMLVQDMLDVARLQSGQIRILAGDVDIVEELKDTVASFEATANAQGVSLHLDVPEHLPCHVDPARVGQIATNLVSNALKFTRRGGHVSMRAAAHDRGVRLEVEDDGTGIDPDHVIRLFQPFGQIHKDPQVPGTGLGLYICKPLAEAMGGSIGVEGRGEESGAKFWVELPLRAPEGPPAQPIAVPASS